jgi:hypothetical protein
MKTNCGRIFSVACTSLLLAGVLHAFPSLNVQYNPATKVVQGNQPLVQSYSLAITSPSNLVAGAALSIPLDITVLSKPAGVNDATALSFITLSPMVLSVTGPNQNIPVTVTVDVPLGDFAGDYAYLIKTSGWSPALSGVDNGATVNARVSPANSETKTPPAVTLLSPANNSTYTYYPTTSTPASVPISFAANVPFDGHAIDTMRAFLGNVQISVTPSGLGTFNASATGTLAISAAGNYTIRVEATNIDGTSEASADITVIAGETPPPPPPVVCQNLTWLPPISLNKTEKGGSTLPIKFTLTCGKDFVRDESTLIAIYEIYSDGTTSAPVIYPYGTGSPNPPDYAITGKQYHLNFPTAKGVHRYRIEVYHPLTADGSSFQLLDSKEFLTR